MCHIITVTNAKKQLSTLTEKLKKWGLNVTVMSEKEIVVKIPKDGEPNPKTKSTTKTPKKINQAS